MPQFIDSIGFDNLTIDPVSPTNGEIWFNTTANEFRTFVNGVVISLNDPRVSNNDTTPAPLFTKLIAGSNVLLEEVNDGGNEKLRINAAGNGVGDGRFTIDVAAMLAKQDDNPDDVNKVVINGFPGLKIKHSKTAFGISGLYLIGGGTSLTVTAKFILRDSHAGTIVRLAARAKVRSTGENTSTGFDAENFVPITVNSTTIGEVFEGTIVLPITVSDNDAVALHVGRDGKNLIAGAGAPDDFGKPIVIIAVEMRVS